MTNSSCGTSTFSTNPPVEDTTQVVAKVEFHPGELFPRLEVIVTNLDTPSGGL